MTCIVGLIDGSNVYIGADSAGVAGYGLTIMADEKVFINDRFIAFNKNYDVYSAFIQLAFQLINKKGFWGFINPVSWQSNENYFDLRNYLKENGKLQIAIKLPYDLNLINLLFMNSLFVLQFLRQHCNLLNLKGCLQHIGLS